MSLLLAEVSHRYRDVRALSRVSVGFDRRRTALIGVNGAGKSTLMAIGSGRLIPSAGRASVGGASLYGRGRRTGLPRVALMPQTADFPGNMTALEVVSYVTWLRGFSRRDSQSQARAALCDVQLGTKAEVKMRQLSGGMTRRVALAQALASRADCLLLDEPSTGLDPEQRKIMVDCLRSIEATVVLSSHVMEDVQDIADRVVVLHQGSVAFDDSLAALLAKVPSSTPRRAEAAFLAVIAGAPASGSGTGP